MQGTSDFTPTTDLINGSPKNMVSYFMLNECHQFSLAMRTPDNFDVDTMIIDLLCYCPDEKKRDEMIDAYERRRDKEKRGKKTAALLTKGDFWIYLCGVMEFTEKSTGGI